MFNAIDFARFAIGTAAKAVAKVPAVNTRFHIGDRLNGPWPEGPFLWMHGASLGECKMLLNLAKFLQEDIENCPKILITSQKAEVVEFIKNTETNIETCIAPADTQHTMAAFAKTVKPMALILGENELWPGYLSTMRRLCLKPSVAIVSGRYRASVPGIDFSPIGFASMQTGDDLSRFMNVAAKFNIASSAIGGDWKLLPWARKGEPVKPAENPTVDVAFVSMHMSEWTSLERMVESSIKRQESVVLVPRRLEEAETFRRALIEEEYTVVDWPLVQKGAISIVNKFGLTGDIFAISKSAVIGGSFARGLGVHNFWEPLQAGVATCIGPFSAGQKENAAALVREGVIIQLRTTADYPRRMLPDSKLVSTFLAHERTKIQDSYQQFIAFLKSLPGFQDGTTK
ncbi:3-deoxy-D-manno-octulosonic acid transferase [Fibrobacter sp. UWR2]|uniref:3-deoxy-D-manno-octulosonic acid transferase n=1 Tax=Fibrobacter sp. UWR2 TaxID=1964352 RepID=UPI000B528B1D|nr:glycosyltransferase N-terminal domain-containing protein [Fibrobacter sp. UWR2]OWV01882.1 3-deoxy-D-manno-octulosonic acid transferase [Fibrobacter sp. UWR2]